MSVIREATLAVTYRCNSRCKMCNIWNVRDHNELPPSAYRNLPHTLKTINLTGGEPFLRKDILEIVREIHGVLPHSRIVISTNGFLTDYIVSSLKDALKFHDRIGVGVSVDGIGPVHDSIRGIPGSYEMAVETVSRLKEDGLRDIRIGMTILNENVHQIRDVYNLSKDLGVEFTAAVAHNSEIFFNKTDNRPVDPEGVLEENLRGVIREYMSTYKVKKWLRAYHLAGITDASIRMTGKGRCEAGSRFVFIDPAGDIYPCLVMNRMIGSLKAGGPDVLTSSDVQVARRAVKACKVDCWMICNIRSLMIRHPLSIISWVAKNKVRSLSD